MSVASIAIESYVVPDRSPVAPDGFELLDITLPDALPSELVLGDGWTVIPVVPTGSARVLLDADSDAIVASSDLERAATDPASPAPAVGAPRLVVRRGGAPLAAVPLVAGVLVRAWSPDGGAGSLLELVPIAWDIRVAAVVGSGPPRSRLTLAWRTRFPAHFEAV